MSPSRAPQLVAGALLLLLALSAKLVAGAAAAAILCLWTVRRRIGRRPSPFIVLAGILGGTLGAILQGTELEPPGPSTLANLLALLGRTSAHGLLVGGLWVGGGASLVLAAFRAAPSEAPGRLIRLLRPFRLAALLLVLAVTPQIGLFRREQTYRATVQADLVSLAWFEARHLERRSVFASDPGALDGFQPSEGVRVTIERADSTAWRARATRAGFTTTCSIGASVACPGVAGEPSDPACAEARRWF